MRLLTGFFVVTLCAFAPIAWAAPPLVTQLSATHGPTSGAIPLTLVGSNFDATSQVTVGASSCVVSARDAIQLVCALPAGQGVGQTVRVSNSSDGTVSNELLFNYDAPILDAISPADGPTTGASITIYGNNFGLSREVTVGGVACPVLAAASSHGTIVCNVPTGAGQRLPLQVTVAGQKSNTLEFSYWPPHISGVTPASGPTQGTTITIVGGSFGSSGASVQVGFQVCPVTLQTHGTLECTVPAGEGQFLPVRVTVQGASSAPAAGALFSYEAPSLSELLPTSGPVTGGTMLTVVGSSFGLDASVTVGGASCAIESVSHGQILCEVPAGAGASREVRVRRAGLLSDALLFSYEAPVIDEISPASGPTSGTRLTITGSNFAAQGAVVEVGGLLCPRVSLSLDATELVCQLPEGAGAAKEVFVSQAGQSSNAATFDYHGPALSLVAPARGPTSGGNLITLVGQNFGASGGSVTVGGSACPIDSQSHTQVVCRAPAGSGALQAIHYAAAGLTASSDLYSYQAPVVEGVSPAIGPKTGGVVLTVTGQDFGPQGAEVTIGGQSCSSAVQTHSQIECILPAGEGYNLPLVVTVAGQSSSPVLYSYESPMPVASGAEVETNEDTPLLLLLEGMDPEGDALTYAVAQPPLAAEGSVVVLGDTVLFTPASNFNGSTSFTFTVSDGESESEPAVVTVQVLAVNDPPVATTIVTSTPEDVAVQIDLVATDADDDALTYELEQQPDFGSVTLEGAQALFTPASHFSGTVLFSYRVTDGELYSGLTQVAVNVLPVDDAPVALSMNVSTLEDHPIRVGLTGFDADGDELVFALDELPSSGTATLAEGFVTYTPAPNFFGTEVLSFTASDASATSATGALTISVLAVNDPPVLAAAVLFSQTGEAVSTSLTAVDVEGSALTYSISAVPDANSGNATLDDNTLTFTPRAGFAGEATFVVSVSDGELSASAPVTILVAPKRVANAQAAGCAGAQPDVWIGALLALGVAVRRRKA